MTLGAVGLLLAWFVYDAVDEATRHTLSYPYLWAFGLAAGGAAAIAMVFPPLRDEWTWIATGVLLAGP